jgi:hypothetical protein
MAARIDDDLLHKFVTVTRHENLAEALLERFGGYIDRIEVSIPLLTESDERALGAIVARLGRHLG